MNDNNPDFNYLIERYIDGDLDHDELPEFEERLKHDPDFARMYHERITIAEKWTLANEYQKTKENVRNIMENGKKKKIISRRYVFSLAAVIVVLLGIYGVLKISHHGQGIFRFEQENNFVIKEDTLENDTSGIRNIKPQIDYAPYKATVDTIKSDSLRDE